jgi:clan AA aspartic protease
VRIDFVIDTGFEGDLALPAHLLRHVADRPAGVRNHALADGSILGCPCYNATLDWNGEDRLTEVLMLEGVPLIGTALLEDYLLQIEMTEGGEVVLDPL